MKKSLGELIAELRKEKGLTQAQLASQMCVTDKAVSKWERDLSCPDINSIPRLAEILGVSVEQLMQGQKQENKTNVILNIILNAVPLAMGVAVVVLSAMNRIDTKSALSMLGIGLSCLALSLLKSNK